MGKKILVVDDDLVIRTLVTDCLSAFGHNVESLDSGKACLERLTRDLPDLVFMDLQMPDMTGIQLLKHIRQNPATETLRVVMLSANDATKELAKEANVRVDHFLGKPFQLQELLELLK